MLDNSTRVVGVDIGAAILISKIIADYSLNKILK